MMKFSLLPILFFSFCSMTCKKEPPTVPPDPKPEIILTLTDTTCTEVWLQLQFKNFTAPHSYKLYRDTTLVFTGTLFTNDTTFIDEELLPQRNYTYKAVRFENNVAKDSSSVLQIKTMDTTSHEFLWEITTLGDGNSSSLSDVVIVNDTLAYAVGEIYLKDSSGQIDPIRYNLAKWSGTKWELQRVTVNFRGNLITPPLTGVCVFSKNDIWLVGSLPIHGDGQDWSIFDIRSMSGFENISVSKAWGVTSSNMYFIGGQGSIIHYNGSSWQKIESGTMLNLYGIHGTIDAKSGIQEILTVGSSNLPLERILLKIEDKKAIPISTTPIQWSLYDVWFASHRRYYVVGSGIYMKQYLSDSTWKNNPLDITNYSTSTIDGDAINNIVASGAYGEVLHFNGYRWKSYIDLGTRVNGAYSSTIRGNIIIAAGYNSNKAAVAVGRRLQ